MNLNQNLPSIFGRRDRRGLTETAATGLGGLMPPHVSIKGNRFALVDAGGGRFPLQTMYLDCIVIDINPNICKTYWGPDPYQDGDDQPPLCFSDNGVGPSAQSTEPQSRTCAECEHNAWGSATNEQTGKNRKACSDRRKAAVVVLNDPTGHCYQLQIPPASLKPFLKYSGQLQAMNAPGLDRKADMDDVVTRIAFADNKNGELQFEAVAWINSVQMTTMGLQLVTQQTAQGVQVALAPDGGAAVAEIIDGLLDRKTTDTIVNKNDRPWSGALQIAQAAPQAQIACRLVGWRRVSRPDGPMLGRHSNARLQLLPPRRSHSHSQVDAEELGLARGADQKKWINRPPGRKLFLLASPCPCRRSPNISSRPCPSR